MGDFNITTDLIVKETLWLEIISKIHSKTRDGQPDLDLKTDPDCPEGEFSFGRTSVVLRWENEMKQAADELQAIFNARSDDDGECVAN